MARRDGFPGVFAGLKGVLAGHAPPLTVATDANGDYAVLARPSAKYPDGHPFGAVQIKKSYVSFHLFPLYEFPDLLDGLPERIRKRMQGKSCFNFTALDEETVDGLTRLTAAGQERYRRAGLV